MACQVIQRLARKLYAADQLTIVAYDDTGYVLAQGIYSDDRAGLADALANLSTIGGGGSNLAMGLEVVRRSLRREGHIVHPQDGVAHGW